jgi:hypothetical protein
MLTDTLWARVKESITWLSVQVQIGWSFVWFMYSQLPSETMVQLAQVQFKLWVLSFTVPGLMGLAHAATTYLARIKKAPAPAVPTAN